MIRLFRIAVRDYLAYVRTLGFWLSILLMPVGLTLFATAPVLMDRTSPPPTLAVVDFTHQGYEAAIRQALISSSSGERVPADLVAMPGGPFTDPAAATARAKVYVANPRDLSGGAALDAVAILKPAPGSVAIDLWSRNVTDPVIDNLVRQAVADQLRRTHLEQAGVDRAALAAIDALQPKVANYSPKATGQVTFRDKLPGLAGFVMGMLLWTVIFTGAGMLLNSIIEEKSSRILEVLLSSASVPEIMGGKILGVACVTSTVMAVWLGVGAAALAILQPQIAADVVAVLLSHGMIAYLALYFVGGYLMFATLYVTVGAFCETTREAQTLLGPMMILLSLPIIFMSQAITHPDSPLLETLSWVPIFTPFMMAARAASDPPLWEVVGTAVLMFATTAFELWVAGPAFKSGALSTGRFELRVFLASLMRREAA
ncbi:MAG TPA: ABC transporter permease [Caulobacteraceae bacterium]